MGKFGNSSGQTSLDEFSLEGSSLSVTEGQTLTHHQATVTGPVTAPTGAISGASTSTATPVTTGLTGTITENITLPVAKRNSPDEDVAGLELPASTGVLGFCRENPALLVLGFSGLVMVVGVGIGYVFLTTPKVITGTSQTCQSRISGTWQTGVGLLQLQPASNGTDVVGKYQYSNSIQGNVTGQISGTMDQNVMNFTWQETTKPEDGKPNSSSHTSQGKGILFFSQNCQEVSGTSGQGEDIKGHRRWDGTWQAPKK